MKNKSAEERRRGPQPVPRRLASCVAGRRTKQLRCKAIARSGERCKTAPLHGKKYCMLHTGDNARVLGAKGGRRRAIFNPDGLEPFAAPKDAGDLTQLLAQTLVETRSGRIDPRVANTIAYLGTAFLSALEVAAFEPRLRALEALIMPSNGAASPSGSMRPN